MWILAFLAWTSGSIVAEAKTISVRATSVGIERSATGEDTVYAARRGKIISRITLDRLPAAPDVLKFEAVRGTDYVLLDYLKGSSGTTALRECYDVVLLKVSPAGKLSVREKIEYRCDSAATDDSFHRPYRVQITKGEASLTGGQPNGN